MIYQREWERAIVAAEEAEKREREGFCASNANCCIIMPGLFRYKLASDARGRIANAY